MMHLDFPLHFDARGQTAAARDDPGYVRQLVELVADYLDGLLPEKIMADVEDHLAGCDGCTAYLSQIRQTIVQLRRQVL